MSRGSSRRRIAEPKILVLIWSLPRHHGSRFSYGPHDVLVTGAPAQIAFEAPADLFVGGIRIFPEQIVRRQDHARRAEAALQAVFVPEGLLQGVQLAVRGQPLDRRDGGPVDL